MPERENLILFTGENAYTLHEEILRWKESFCAKHGQENMSILQENSVTFSQLLNEISSAPFIAEKRMVILYGIPRIEKEQMEMVMKEQHEQCILVIVEPKPDNRTTVTKLLKKEATLKEFAPLQRSQLLAWLTALGREHGCTLTPAFCNALLQLAGNDQWNLKMETLKAIAFAHPEPPDERTLERICIPTEAQTVWALSDRIGQSDMHGALRLCYTLQKSGQDMHALWNMFLWMVRNIATIALYEHGRRMTPATLAKEAGIPFPSAQALLPFVRSLDPAHLQEFVSSIMQEEFDLKTGRIRATAENQIELAAVLERCLLKCGK